ncbi:post-GPI attachment to proteins factor 2-like [Diabrotica virgifera virgifera]|uniref:Post-GPI attachment to proteins factor 2-like isoform X1 n=1 Tax=Diabrotica virgifera virgifera TaxID=50390 RepID=A0A6P7HD45_DIAVI|nr:post-GPI attachment to proteins factor 2-like [Diabrotica virgifera virgifera]
MSKEAQYGLLYSEYEYSSYFRVPFEKFCLSLVGIPFVALIFCIFYSVLFNFESATYTHCEVYNMLPSISAAIGSFSPQREIWQMAIAVHAVPRFIIAWQYLHLHFSVLHAQDIWIAQVAFFLNIVENFSLIVLSFFVSSQNYAVHKKAFVLFIITSEIYMILSCILQSRFKKQFRISLKWKKRFLVTNVICILAATYFFMRHNSFCEPYVYTLFALCEYIVVLSNMAFHLTAYFDFKNKDIVIYKHGLALTER